MDPVLYIEDIFLKFYEIVFEKSITIDRFDIDPCRNFYRLCIEDKPLTERQGIFMVKILEKYKDSVKDVFFDYSECLALKKFKRDFRIIDNSKKIYLEEENGQTSICFQFPFSFKDTFDREFGRQLEFPYYSKWDAVKKARTIDLFSVNILTVYDFVEKNQFFIDDSFFSILADLDHALENQDSIIPSSYLINQQIGFISIPEETKHEFLEKNFDTIDQQLFYAKTMGYPCLLKENVKDPLSKIISSKSNIFWTPEIDYLFSLYKKLKVKVVIIIDRAQDQIQWLDRFLHKSIENNIPNSKIKICFRENKEDDKGLNKWIKNNNLGGKIEDSDILIFNHKPAKWVFKEDNFVKILVTTMINPSTHAVTKDWLETHPCVIYLTDIRPTIKGNKKIVQL
jgi:hypothetical protein